jgi:hypothetical protein
MKCPNCGKEINIKKEIDAELAKAKKSDRLTNEDKAKNKAYYFKLELDSHKKRVTKIKVTDKEFDSMVSEKAELLKGHQVFSCSQEYQAPADEERAKKGLHTELVTAVRNWMEVDGLKIHTNASAAEIRELLNKANAPKAKKTPKTPKSQKAAPKSTRPVIKPAPRQQQQSSAGRL